MSTTWTYSKRWPYSRTSAELLSCQTVSYDVDTAEMIPARVPVMKFVDGFSGLACNVAIGNTNAVFKSKVLKQLAVKDARFPKLLRLVKALAREPGILGGRDGRLNSYCITQMVIFHLQTCEQKILPPLCELFGISATTKSRFEQRPMHCGVLASAGLLQVSHFTFRQKSWPST